ncbi:DUF726 family protein [Schizosaccharomyces japonicus yFS275]|uniref:DUF726 family protein n=1 Tax=Schizosaccharomyces japonicus (strain yFS275 / FY16936) TaxID=402676 RepID=B6JXS0_SCHJY|nr:DUF726 family protein [Schizosaccharomyces japonicus yFS275]EEB06338.1 DUF726 family protein [Schizosaccharomyces japonicus yFS275]
MTPMEAERKFLLPKTSRDGEETFPPQIKSSSHFTQSCELDDLDTLSISSRTSSHRDEYGLSGTGTLTELSITQESDTAASLSTIVNGDIPCSGDTTASGEHLPNTSDIILPAEKIAYAGICRLVLSSMVDRLAYLHRLPWYKGECKNALESFILWSESLIEQIFEHLELSAEEQKMINSLQRHGIRPSDLAPQLTQCRQIGTLHSLTENGSDLFTNTSITDDSSEINVRWTVIFDLFVLLLSKFNYDSRSNAFLNKIGSYLGASVIEVTKFQNKVINIFRVYHKETPTDTVAPPTALTAVMKTRSASNRKQRYVMMGLATLGGGLIIGLSSGLLAPIISAGISAAFSTVGLTSVAASSFFTTGASAAMVTTGGVIAGGHLGCSGMMHRKADVKTFEFKPLYDNKRSSLLLTISGWMSNADEDVRLGFSTLSDMTDVYSLYWEPEMLQSAGQTINLLATEVLSNSLQQLLGATMFVSLIGALQWPLILTKLGYLIDNPWNNSLDRARICGYILADMLTIRFLGRRPVSLIGFSLGARVVYYCLKELERRKEFGVVENVFIFGTPVIYNQSSWVKAMSVVSGRFVNGYKKNDWILGYLFRATSGGVGTVVGLRNIDDIPGMENMDVTDLVDGHLGYKKAMPMLLAELGFELTSDNEHGIMDPEVDADLEQQRERQRELLRDIEIVKCQNKQRELAKEAVKHDPTKKNIFFNPNKIRKFLEKNREKNLKKNK